MQAEGRKDLVVGVAFLMLAFLIVHILVPNFILEVTHFAMNQFVVIIAVFVVAFLTAFHFRKRFKQ